MLKRSKDRKVTNRVSKNGKNALGANSFGLPSGVAYSCPGATSFCERICYAGKLEKIYSGVKNILVHNWTELLYADYLDGVTGMVRLLDSMVSEFSEECDATGAEKVFRIHWDGDFFSLDYATAWAIVADSNPDVTFWVYTRSFTDDLNVLPVITGFPNVIVYLSADPVNIDLANKRAQEFPGVFIATVADTFALAKETIVDTARKTYNCPENGKRIALISEKGSACVSCGICVRGRGDVLFSVKKK